MRINELLKFSYSKCWVDRENDRATTTSQLSLDEIDWPSTVLRRSNHEWRHHWRNYTDAMCSSSMLRRWRRIRLLSHHRMKVFSRNVKQLKRKILPKQTLDSISCSLIISFFLLYNLSPLWILLIWVERPSPVLCHGVDSMRTVIGDIGVTADRRVYIVYFQIDGCILFILVALF